MKLSFLLFLALFAFCGHSYGWKPIKSNTDSTTVTAEDSAAEAKKKVTRTRYIDVSCEYGSNFTYRHQIDATPTEAPYLYPSIYYHDKTGFYASVAAYRLLNNYVEQISESTTLKLSPGWIETDFTLGWEYTIAQNTDISASYMFSAYDRQYPLVAQALRNTFEAYIGHDFNIINSGLRYDYCYQNFTGTIKNKRVDVPVHDNYLMWENSHEFFIDDVFVNDDEFDIAPMFTILAGTNNFIGSFIIARFPTSAKAVQYADLSSKFLVQQFSLNVPVAYTIGNFTATPAFEYTVLTQKKTETSPTSFPVYRFSLAYRLNLDRKKKK